MGEIRLVPAALVVWAAAAVAITLGVGIAVVVVLVAVIGAVVLRAYGQAVFIAGMGAAAVVTTGVRLHIARAWEPRGSVRGPGIGRAEADEHRRVHRPRGGRRKSDADARVCR